MGPPLRASNEGLLRPRVARAGSVPSSFLRASFLLNDPSRPLVTFFQGMAWLGTPTAHVEQPPLYRGGSVSTGD